MLPIFYCWTSRGKGSELFSLALPFTRISAGNGPSGVVILHFVYMILTKYLLTISCVVH